VLHLCMCVGPAYLSLTAREAVHLVHAALSSAHQHSMVVAFHALLDASMHDIPCVSSGNSSTSSSGGGDGGSGDTDQPKAEAAPVSSRVALSNPEGVVVVRPKAHQLMSRAIALTAAIKQRFPDPHVWQQFNTLLRVRWPGVVVVLVVVLAAVVFVGGAQCIVLCVFFCLCVVGIFQDQRIHNIAIPDVIVQVRSMFHGHVDLIVRLGSPHFSFFSFFVLVVSMFV
jgi:hypothetical protein